MPRAAKQILWTAAPLPYCPVLCHTAENQIPTRTPNSLEDKYLINKETGLLTLGYHRDADDVLSPVKASLHDRTPPVALCPLMKVPVGMTGCERERAGEDEERNGGREESKEKDRQDGVSEKKEIKERRKKRLQS
ncbi:Hypothetical protein SMAX5B_017284 [Scophthalmus maximus]|uniref:Uncharacterized protein n=1 Tax=Scophthalmus maximus TaxID=52904 RepID=A0A2U9CN63_SCOMX|nr:Hypothetical protein SMAX5B_017284 [Scophthalmus maximus]